MRLSAEHAADGAARLEGFLLAGDTAAEAWIRTLLPDALPPPPTAGSCSRPVPAAIAVAARGRQVCSCFDVGESAIAACLDAVERDDAAPPPRRRWPRCSSA